MTGVICSHELNKRRQIKNSCVPMNLFAELCAEGFPTAGFMKWSQKPMANGM